MSALTSTKCSYIPKCEFMLIILQHAIETILGYSHVCFPLLNFFLFPLFLVIALENFPIYLFGVVRKNFCYSLLWIKANWEVPSLVTILSSVIWCPEMGNTIFCVDLLSRKWEKLLLQCFHFGINVKLELRRARCNSTFQPSVLRQEDHMGYMERSCLQEEAEEKETNVSVIHFSLSLNWIK